MADEPLTLTLGPSARLACLLVVAHLVVAAAAWIALPAWWWSGVLSIAISASLVVSLTRHALRTAAQAVVEIVLRRDASARFTLRDGRVVEGRLDGSSFVATSLVIITLIAHPRHRRVSAVVASDALAPEAFRRQRMWLLWARGDGGTDDLDGD
jgi:hypothetical protein